MALSIHALQALCLNYHKDEQ